MENKLKKGPKVARYKREEKLVDVLYPKKNIRIGT